jgi:tRNA (cmo5U34)-methyltransferase
MGVKQAFDRAARDYDVARRRLVPRFDDFYGAALASLPFPRCAAPSVVDLGAGTGLLAGRVGDAWPNARLTLVDVSGAMLAVARLRFRGRGGVRLIEGDYSTLELRAHDAVVSALSIHHLEADAKRALFARLQRSLRPGGVFVNADQVAGETPDEDARQRARWEAEARAGGASDAELEAARERMREDRPSTVGEQLAWLAEAEFAEPGCVYRQGMFAVLAARKPGGPGGSGRG